MTTAMFAVEGMICESCMAAVLEKVHSLSGVTDVAMDLVTGGRSPLIVTSEIKLGVDAVREAVENVGFDLKAAGGPGVRKRDASPSTQDGDTRTDRERMTASIGGVSS